MEQSKQFSDVLALGKKLVQELGLVQSVDTLSRWMAHYISELILEANQAEDEKKQKIQTQCQKAILDLWKHIEVFPRGARPLEDLEPIFATIRALNPDVSTYFYEEEAQKCIDRSKLSEEAKQWLDLSRGLDYSARLLINMCLKKVVEMTLKECQEWAGLSRKANADKIPIIDIVQKIDDDLIQVESGKDTIKKRIELLQDHRDRLQSMIDMAELLAKEIDSEIVKLNY